MKGISKKLTILSAAMCVMASGCVLGADTGTSYTTTFGDVVGDSKIDVFDMEAVQKELLDIGQLVQQAEHDADVDRNGKIDVVDMEAIQKDILEIEKIENINVINQVNNVVSVHDPSIIKDEKTGTYYIFGTHMSWAKSTDLVNWTTFKNNINTSYATLFATEAAWAKKAGSSYNVGDNLWAPDVIWNDTMNKWCMYMSVNGPDWNSTICLLTADKLDGNWTYVGSVVQSGMSRGYGPTFDYQKVTGTTDVSRYTSHTRNNGKTVTYEPHAIDPCVLYDDNGDLWMSYGSWSGGIGMFKLDKATGLRDYNTKYTLNGADLTDPYYGYKIAGGNQVSGEASYIQKIGDYYYLFISYGGLNANGGYSMRIFRSENIYGPYKDKSGDYARYPLDGATGSANAGNVTGTVGIKLMTYYKWNTMNVAQVAQGHNSAFVDEDGKAYVVFHTRTNDGTEGHYVKVHQLFTNEDGWLVAAPYQYSGETLNETGYSMSKVAGTYDVMLHKQNVAHASLEYVSPVDVTLNADGTVTGTYTGTWSLTEGTPYITITMNNVTYKGVVIRQMIEGTKEDTMCFTLLGNNEVEAWGSKQLENNRALDMVLDNFTVASVAMDDMDLPTEGMYNTQISWKSSNTNIIAADGKVTLPAQDTEVTLTATFTNDKTTRVKEYKVTVYAGSQDETQPYVIARYYTDQPLDISNAGFGTYFVPNPFNRNNTAGLEIDNGAAIEFEVTSKGASDRLGAIIGFKDSDTSGAGGMCYFTAGSYLGYNALGGFYDANMKDWVLQKDYLGSASAASSTHKVRIDFLPTGYQVTIDGTVAYTNAAVDAGTTAGGNSLQDYTKVLEWLNSSATKLHFGAGTWWDDLHFNGSIKNVVCYAYPVEKIDTSGYVYYQGFDKSSSANTWTHNGSATGVLESADDRGKYLKVTVGGDAGNRGSYTMFDMDSAVTGKYNISFDMALTAGVLTQRSVSGFALLGADAAGHTVNSLVSSGYIFKLENQPPAGTAANQTNKELQDQWTLNGSTTITIPVGTWVNVTADVDTTAKTANLTIQSMDSKTTYYTGTVQVNGSGELGGMQVLSGRGIGTTLIDTIAVTDKNSGSSGGDSGNTGGTTGGISGGDSGNTGGTTGGISGGTTESGTMNLQYTYYDKTQKCVVASGSTASGNITIPSSVQKDGVTYTVAGIDEEAFLGQPITGVTMPDTIEAIMPRAFMNCSKLASIKFSSALATINQRAFYFCTSLTEITLPSSLTNMDQEAFAECKSLTTIHATGTAANLARGLQTGSSFTVTN